MKTELAALKQRSEDLSYMIIEAEGETYFEYAIELERVEYEIHAKENEMSEIVNLYRKRGVI